MVKVLQFILELQELVLSSTTSSRLSVPLYANGTSRSIDVHSSAFISTLPLNTKLAEVTGTQSVPLLKLVLLVWTRYMS